MAVKLTKDGEVDKRTKEYKDSQKKKFRWWKIPFLSFLLDIQIDKVYTNP
jgi:hypothetical protein